ncbi:MAG TPA: hypothetical protein VMZ92_04605 [Planctomycetota bacterium]|nr:hypothetical protein [Planctomycetota bacterium]
MTVAKRPHIEIRGIYGGMPEELMTDGRKLTDSGINAVFMHSGAITAERVGRLHDHGAKVFAEFNSMHHERYLEENPDAAPVGTDGEVCPPPEGWQGICPTHPGYRVSRMQEFRRLLETCDLDGIWLDYHHSHASWERAEPVMPDTCFCGRCVERFRRDTGETHAEPQSDAWVRWRCDLFTDWVREYREIRDAVRPAALFGTFHNPWSDDDRDGARLKKLAIDLRAQAEHLDVFSIMPYHARFGHSGDVDWISRQVSWLGRYLGIEGKPGERHKIWPIVQLSDWGEPVDPSEVAAVMDHATRPPATGVTIFAWDGIRRSLGKVRALTGFYRGISGIS